MEFKELDFLFDEALKRSASKTTPAIDPQAQGPHSADHFLLKKSWDYFKERIRSIESHWEEIKKAKDDEVGALKKELALAHEELAEAELKNKMLDQFEEEIRRTRSGDFIDFKKLSERLHHAWEEERQRLMAQLSAAEFALGAEREKKGALDAKSVKEMGTLMQKIDALKEETDKLVQKNAEDKRQFEQVINGKDQELSERQVKIDKQNMESERLEQKIKDQAGELASLGTKVDALLLRIKQTDEGMKDRDERIRVLRADLERVEFEKNSVKKAWAEEQAQWRELWDRNRELWDKR